MRYLLDTHSLIWFSLDHPQLSAKARILIKDPDNEILISPVSLWEIAIKVSISKLSLNQPYQDFVDRCLTTHMFQLLSIEPAHTTLVASMPYPPGHKDPFDRLLIAQAIAENLPIVGIDVAFDAYPIQRIW